MNKLTINEIIIKAEGSIKDQYPGQTIHNSLEYGINRKSFFDAIKAQKTPVAYGYAQSVIAIILKGRSWSLGYVGVLVANKWAATWRWSSPDVKDVLQMINDGEFADSYVAKDIVIQGRMEVWKTLWEGFVPGSMYGKYILKETKTGRLSLHVGRDREKRTLGYLLASVKLDELSPPIPEELLDRIRVDDFTKKIVNR
ncbi:MAG: hypothetical protein U9Q66_04030 [Patescibacteria group bacterium]|nr:hypothetical protein [Patescibacteria group bacterium]